MELLTSVIVATAIFVITWFVRRSKSTQSITPTKNYPKDTVLLHQVGRGPYAPSISPFCVKLETFLRITKVPYQNVHDGQRGPKGKVPWIEYNGERVPDTEFCVEYLNEKRNVDLNKNLSQKQRSSARALERMVDEHTYWIMIYYRWLADNDKEVMKLAKWSNIKIWLVARLARLQTYFHGIGRHSHKDVEHILDKDLKALSEYLGDKKYFMGEEPSEVDCSVFGQLSQFMWHLPGTDGQQLIVEKYSNLNEYMNRVKTTFWPDWKDCTTHGKD